MENGHKELDITEQLNNDNKKYLKYTYICMHIKYMNTYI